MIPVRDTLEPGVVPFTNISIVVICAAAFAGELLVGDALEAAVDRQGLVPARFFALAARHGYFEPALYAPLVSSLFLHGGALHLGLNMIFLWIFGDDVEARFGHVGYACFFLLAGAVAGGAQLIAYPASTTPTIGASGAIAGVMGAYLVLHPRAGIWSVVFPVFWVQLRVPAVVYLVLWFVFQLAMAASGIGTAGSGGVAWWTHAAGFGFGALVVGLLGRKQAPPAKRTPVSVEETVLRSARPASPRRARR